MKAIVMMVVMLGLAGSVYAEIGTIEAFNRSLKGAVSATVLDEDYVQYMLADMFENGVAVSWKELAGNGITDYDLKFKKHSLGFAAFSVAKTRAGSVTAKDLFWVNFGCNNWSYENEEASGSSPLKLESVRGNATDVELHVKKAEYDGKTYLVMKYFVDFTPPTNGAYRLKGYALLVEVDKTPAVQTVAMEKL
ncbi:MAG: hypothetical protein WCW52_10145 [Elusimicrobiales bacterium]|jgi:hypothetical protein